ncbi:hypothetical protein GJAV_G00179910 [Gymnothorax javanicus]|nr:hypothetical protein GJAV_G00179910 [Gymnothorax javanicus]
MSVKLIILSALVLPVQRTASSIPNHIATSKHIRMYWLVIFSFYIGFASAAVPETEWTSEHSGDYQRTCSASNQETCTSDLYEDLWNNNKYIADETLDLPFLKHMQSGSLSAEDYINFTLQDVKYLDEVVKMLYELINTRSIQTNTTKFLRDRYRGYSSYLTDVLESFSMEEPPNIKLHPAMAKYINTYKDVMRTKDPIYFVVALLPCSRLWPYLAKNLKMKKDNAYYKFKTSNENYNPAKHFKPFLNRHQKKIDIDVAHEVFRQQMKNEKSFFAESFTPNRAH